MRCVRAACLTSFFLLLALWICNYGRTRIDETPYLMPQPGKYAAYSRSVVHWREVGLCQTLPIVKKVLNRKSRRCMREQNGTSVWDLCVYGQSGTWLPDISARANFGFVCTCTVVAHSCEGMPISTA